MKKHIPAIILSIALSFSLQVRAQEYVSPTAPTQTGRSPGVKVKLLDSSGQSKTYVLVFSPGDEVKSGLTEFAQKYKVKSAHFTAIGDADSAKVGFYDHQRKMFKVISINSPCEVTSLTGNIAWMDGKPVAHAHVNVSDSNGLVHGGHLLEMVIGPTLEVYVITTPTAVIKKTDTRYGAGVIDPALKD